MDRLGSWRKHRQAWLYPDSKFANPIPTGVQSGLDGLGCSKMKTTRISLKDGTKLTGVLWLFRPREGYLTLTGAQDDGNPMLIKLIDCASAIQEKVLVHKDEGPVDQDLLKRARDQGWDGVSYTPPTEVA